LTAVTREGGAAWNFTPWKMTVPPVQLREPSAEVGVSTMQRLKASVAAVGTFGGLTPARKARASQENTLVTSQPAPSATLRSRPPELPLTDVGRMTFRNPFEADTFVTSPKRAETMPDMPMRSGVLAASSAVRQSLGGSADMTAGMFREDSVAKTPPALYERKGSPSGSGGFFDVQLSNTISNTPVSNTLAVPSLAPASQASSNRRESDSRESMLGRGESYYWKRPPSPKPS
jgi:hypothetical protein